MQRPDQGMTTVTVATPALLSPQTATGSVSPVAHTSPQRILCHTYGRDKDRHIPVPGWPYSVICALETGRSSWTTPLDALRLAPGATVTARQMRELVERLVAAGQWTDGDRDILVVVDAGYVPGLA